MIYLLYSALCIVFLAFIIIFVSDVKAKRFCFCILGAAVLLEFTLFNWQSYRLICGGYEKTALSLKDITAVNFKTNGDGSLTAVNLGTSSVQFDNINKRIGTLYIEFELSENITEQSYKVSVSDETSKPLRNPVISGVLYSGNARSGYAVCELSGEVSRIKLSFTTGVQNAVTIKSVTINEAVPLEILPLRTAAIFICGYLIYTALFCHSLKKPCSTRRFFGLKLFSGVMAALFVIIASVMVFVYAEPRSDGILSHFTSSSGNQITKELVDAFEKGQAELLIEPDPKLLELENPYDRNARDESGARVEWDHVLYDGRYYSYYGIAPVITLFLPYHLITGYYFPTFEAVLLYGAGGIIFLILLYYELIKRFFPELPMNMAFSGLILTVFSCGIWFCFASLHFYEIAQSSGFLCTAAGLYFLVRSGVMEREGRISLSSACLSSVMLSLAVLCRPTLAVYCVCALIFIAFGAARLKREGGKTVRYLLLSLLPFVLFGGLQMAYNYIRFDSPFDFGIQYSLTINDFTHAEFHVGLAMIGFVNFLFIAPAFSGAFPFVFPSFTDLGVNGYYFIANRSAIGIIFRALPTFSYLALPKAVKSIPKGERKRLIMPLSVCLIAPFVIILSIWESGYGVRYCADFSFQIVLGALAVAFFLFLKRNDSEMKRLIEVLFVTACAVSVYINFAHVYNYFMNNL